MDLGQCILVGIDDSILKKCVRRAAKFRPCLCDYVSDQDAIIDVYITNRSPKTFLLVEAENIVATGPFADQRPGVWIVAPPHVLCSGETVFMRAYSGKVSTTDHSICSNPVQLTIDIRYEEASKEGFHFEIVTIRESEGGGCSGLQPFEPIFLTDFNVSGALNETSFPGSARPLNIYSLQAPVTDPRWRNTAYFLLS